MISTQWEHLNPQGDFWLNVGVVSSQLEFPERDDADNAFGLGFPPCLLCVKQFTSMLSPSGDTGAAQGLPKSQLVLN